MARKMSKTNSSTPAKAALFSPPFRFYMGGHFVASVGDWIDMTALNWAVLQMTNSPLHLALINACRLVPIFLLSIPSGVLADRYDRRRLLILIQSGVTLLTLVIGSLLAFDNPFWLFAAAVTLRSCLVAMAPPVRNSFIPSLVPQHSMANALAMYVSVANLSRIIGPAIAGVLLGFLAKEQIFALVAVGYAVELVVLIFLRTKLNQQLAMSKRKRAPKAGVREAIAYIKTHKTAQSLLLLAIVPMVFGFPYTSMLPVFAKELLNVGPDGFGALLSVSAVGALLGSLWLSLGRERRSPGKWLICSLLGFGVSLTLFMLAEQFMVAAVMMFWVGFTSQTYRTLSRITLQMQVPDHLRGRIMSIALMDRGFIPLGALMIGSLATTFGTMFAGLVMGVGCVAITLGMLLMRRQLWRI